MGSFFKRIIQDSRSSPRFAAQPESAFVRVAAENSHMDVHIPVPENERQVGKNRSSKTDKLRTDNNDRVETFSSTEENPEAIDQQSANERAGQGISAVTVPSLQHEQPPIALQSTHGLVLNEENAQKQGAVETYYIPQTTGNAGILDVKQPVDAVTGGQKRDKPKTDRQFQDAGPDSVINREQWEIQSVKQNANDFPFDKNMSSISEIVKQENEPVQDSETVTANAFKHAHDKTPSMQPADRDSADDVIAQEKHNYSFSPQTGVIRNETRIENTATRSIKENHAEHFPQVKIGLVNVIVEGPRKTQAVTPATQRDDQTSRNFLRSL